MSAYYLFAEHGYRGTTIAEIAEAADVAPRTVTFHFPVKEDLLFAADPFALESLRQRIHSRAEEESTLNVLRQWMATTMTLLASEDAEAQLEVWNARKLRAEVIDADIALRARARAGYFEYEQLIAAGIAEDLKQEADALEPHLAATAVVAGLRELYTTREVQRPEGPPSTSELMSLVDVVIAFAEAGLLALENGGIRE